MNRERIESELARLAVGGQRAEIVTDGNRPVVLYHDVPTAGGPHGLPETSDVIVPIPEGHPAAAIDLAGLPAGSPLLPRVKGGNNNQGNVTAGGRQWQLASYHPHNGGGAPPYDQNKHGFHTYFDSLVSWLARLN
jgi:hypothetical protein